ncbi:MAG: GNVR domain-containing protein [Fidelibacterota bacterium]
MTQNKQETVKDIMFKVMQHFGYRHQYEVAKYFNVTAQTLSGWIKTNTIPTKHLVKYTQEIAEPDNDQRVNIEKEKIFVELPMSSDRREFSEKLISITKIRSLLAKSIRLLILLPVLFSSISAVYVFFIADPVYSSISKVLPIAEDNNALSGISGMASQFGFNIPTGVGSVIPWDDLYPEIVHSENLMRVIVQKKIKSEKYGPDITLLDVLASEGRYDDEEHDVKLKMAVENLKKMITVQKNRLSPIVTIVVNGIEPQFASDIASAVLDESGKILRNLKTKQITEKRLFIENRIVEVRASLLEAENAVEEFRHTNRNINQSAFLSIEENRLTREVELQNSLYVTLKTQYEQAKIEEVEEATLIQIIDGPLKPLKMISPKPFITISLSFFFGFILALFTVYSREYIFSSDKLTP